MESMADTVHMELTAKAKSRKRKRVISNIVRNHPFIISCDSEGGINNGSDHHRSDPIP